ncbi:MAG: hypothetical protein QOE97_2058, partial [Pseudonocardiales bacterium]|nr:hypothetical protein [Pseudonocardiales bacterium]
MHKSLAILPVLVCAAGVLALAGPASAAPSGTTAATFAVTGGTLDIAVPASVNLGSVTASSAAQGLTGVPLGAVTVTDGRGVSSGWVATASATDFTGPQTLAGATVYRPTLASATNATVTPAADQTLAPTAATVQTATLAVGVNSATWNPTLTVTIPANALAGTYSSTITQS